ncbi:periplasmic component of amino acid ABC-type transporter/signal transduction system [Synechococcus sp. PCC 6312]|nr:periplasmic component of amino acid ABC-type transporter/signal transduction system [Synechococcus sp. PCC 6312]
MVVHTLQKTMTHKLLRLSGIVLLSCFSLVACDGDAPPASTSAPTSPTPTATSSNRLAIIKQRGKLVCGVSGELPGFSFVDAQGNYAGLDADLCRAVATTLFNDPNAVEFRNLNAKERFLALQTGEVDLLSRNTTLTMSRDTNLGITFAPVVFYDGQAVMVRQSSGITKLADLAGKSVCMQAGTTNEQNFTDQMRTLNAAFTPVVFEDVNTTFATYSEGRCDAVTADRSQLVSRRQTLPNAAQNIILPEVFSKEPLAPAVIANDPAWSNTVRWTIYALINAEELGITQANLSQQLQSPNPNVRRFLGVEGELGQGLGVAPDFVANIIKAVGNYGEIYERNLGRQTPLKLERGQNNLWTKGGLMYSPPFR